MNNRKISDRSYLLLGLLMIAVVLYGWWVNGVGEIYTWIVQLSVGITFLIRSTLAPRNTEDERDKMVKYKSTQIAFIITLIFISCLFFGQAFLRKELSSDNILTLVAAILIISQSLSQYIYNKVM